MAPLDYDKLYSFVEKAETDTIDSIQDAEIAECLDELRQVDSDSEKQDSLSKLFRAALIIAEFKSAQADAYSQGAEEEAERSAHKEAELEGRVQDLQEELSKLRMQMAAGDTGKDGQTLRAEVERLQDDVLRIEKDKRDTDIELAEEKNKTDRLDRQVHEHEKLSRDYQTQIRGLEYQVEEMRKRVITSTEGQNARSADKEEVQRKLKLRTEQIMELMDQLQTLTTNNESLTGELDDIKQQLEEATVQMHKTADINLELKEALLTSDIVIESLQNEKDELKSHGGRTTGIDSMGGSDLMNAVEKKIEDWKNILNAKDSENISLKEKMEKLQTQINEYNIDSDKSSVAALSKALEDRDQQIKALKKQLDHAVKDMNEITEMVEAQKVLYTGSDDKSGARMAQLVKKLKDMESRNQEVKKKADESEGHAVKKDKEFAALLARMNQYEKGEYGLSEAVKEVQDLKTQIEFRNKQIGQLTNKCTDLYQDIQELNEENSDYRERLGLQKRQIRGDTKNKLAVHDPKKDSDRAMNIILQQEIDRLEDERVELKLKMRSMAQKIGQKAAALGLSVEDTLLLDQIADGLKKSRTSTMTQITQLKEMQDINQPFMNLATQQDKLIHGLHFETSDMSNKISQLEAENLDLIEALKFLKSAMKPGETTGSIQCPPLERLLKRIETQHVGQGKVVQQMQSKVDQAMGGNEQLKELVQQTTMALQTAQQNIEQLKVENMELKEKFSMQSLVDEDFNAIQIPDGTPIASANLIKCLNDQLIKVIHEITTRKKQEETTDQLLHSYQSKFSVLKHSYGVLHEQLLSKTNEFESDKKSIQENYDKLKESHEYSLIKIQEYDRLLETMSRGGTEIERRVAEMSRKFTVSLINEKVMSRKYSYLLKDNSFLRQSEHKLENQALQRDKLVSEHIAYLARQKEMGSFEIKSLQQAISKTIPMQDHQKFERQLEGVTEKYRKLLEKDTASLQNDVKCKELEVEVKKLMIEKEALQKVIDAEKQKVNVYGLKDQLDDDTSDNMHSKLKLLQVKELNERQRADYAQARYETIREDMRVIEERNMQLESKLGELGDTCLHLQNNEQALQNIINDSISKSMNEENLLKIKNLEKSQAELHAELEAIKSVADVAHLQFDHIHKNESKRNLEIDELRSAVRDLQASTDQRSVIGKLHQDLMHHKLDSTENEEDVKQSRKRIQELQTRILRCEQRYDHKERSLRYARLEHSKRMNFMRKNLQELRQRFAGCIPLKNLEKFNDMIVKLRNDQEIVLKELQRAKEKTEDLEGVLDEMESQKVQLENALGSKYASNILEAVKTKTKSMEVLFEKKFGRRLQKALDQANFYKSEADKQERVADNSDKEIESLIKEFEEKETVWEMQQTELEKRLDHYELLLSTEERTLIEIETGADGIPDPSLPVHVQLEQAIQCLKKNIRIGIDYKREIEQLKRDLANLQSQKQMLEVNSVGQRSLTNHLQAILSHNSSEGMTASDIPQRDHFKDLERMSKASQAAMQALQAQLAQKDESLTVYKKIVDATRAEMQQAQRRHEQELIEVKNEEANVMQDHLKQLRLQMQRFGSEGSDDQMGAQILRIAELEDTVAEQETAIASLIDKLKTVKDENANLRRRSSTVKSPYEGHHDKHKQRKSIASSVTPVDTNQQQLMIPKEPEREHSEIIAASPHTVHPEEIPEEELLSESGSSVSSKHSDQAPTKSNSYDMKSPSVPSFKKGSIASHASHVPVNVPATAHAIEWKVKFERLKRRMADIQKENKVLKITVAELNNEINKQIGQTSSVKRLSDTSPKNGLADIEMKDFKNQLSDLTSALERRNKEVEKLTKKETEMAEDMNDLQVDIRQKNSTISKLKKEKLDIEKEAEGLERRLKSIRESMKMKLTETENRQLKKKVDLLQGQLLQTRRTQPERDTGPDLTKSQTLAKWDERKRYQQQLDRSRYQLDEKNSKIADLEQYIERQKERINRLSEENEFLRKKEAAKSFKDDPTKEDRNKSKPISTTTTPKSDGFLAAENHKLKTKCTQLENRLETFATSLRNMLQPNMDKLVDEPSEDTTVSNETAGPSTEELELMLRELQKMILAYKNGHVNNDEREEFYKTKLSLLEEEVHALGQESQFEYIDKSSGIETINRLHDTIERLEAEKDDLQHTIDQLTMDTSRLPDPDVQKVIRENRELREKLNRAAPRVAWARDLSTAGSGTSTEVGKLKAALEKERHANATLKLQLSELHTTHVTIKEELEHLQSVASNRRKSMAVKDPSFLPQLPSRSKMTSNPKQLEHLLHTEIERSHNLMYENRRLSEKIQALEWRSDHEINTDEYLRTIRNLKAEVNHLQAETQELKLELEVINRNIKPAISAQSNTLDVMLFKERLKNYDAILKENIDLKLKLNSLNPTCLRNMSRTATLAY